MAGFIGLHVGRAFHGTQTEDECPCPKAPCGLVISAEASPDCRQHGPSESGRPNEKTMRQMHFAEDCPGAPEPTQEEKPEGTDA